MTSELPHKGPIMLKAFPCRDIIVVLGTKKKPNSSTSMPGKASTSAAHPLWDKATQTDKNSAPYILQQKVHEALY